MSKDVYVPPVPKTTTYVIVQHLRGYDELDTYAKKAKEMTAAGFQRCRSERGVDGKYWEVWLGFPFLYQGPVRGMSDDGVRHWLITTIGPGEIAFAVAEQTAHYGLGVD